MASFDVIIVGAGVSGLCLARLWLQANTPFRSILVIDGARDDATLRTFSFWSPVESVFESIVRHAWKELRIVGQEAMHAVPLGECTYRTLFWADLQRLVLEEIRRAPRCRVIDGRAEEVVDRGDHVTVRVGAEAFSARWVMDSRFRLADLRVDERRWHSLRQHFTGVLLRAPEGTFDPKAATLFDFRTGLAEGRSFFYVLPFSAEEALVELVTLDREEAAPVIERYVRGTLGLSSYEVVAREHGTSPMTEQAFGWRASGRVRRLGIAAGMVKASTGYALTRIEDDCRGIVRSLEERGDPMAPPRGSRLYRFLDGVLLELWASRPALLPGIFRVLFTKNPADRVLRFLDERAGIGDIVRIVMTLPSWPFLAAMGRWVRRRWFGRAQE
ncbi:lycopene cyclase family protein [Polyangium sp. y55x31]|uniref:lycopene cyclase family protein n=1 Tax=Polyangium sp. y55x31 TaxID=3042688 RepID=UPI002482B1A1|nr:lycopene cyclase family protein [Polyangium sp. y55x31]MDI1483470.1 lycopene cyclase family protein [Polyangium sp. y55x31]